MKELDKDLATDVSLYLLNERLFYDQCEPLRANYSRKWAKGIYDENLAVKGILNHVQLALRAPWFKQYYANIGRVNLPTKTQAAKEILAHWKAEIKDKAANLSN